jgi:hypothetical protein
MSVAFAFLGVSITPNPLTQAGLIKKVLEATGMSDCSTCGSHSLVSPLGTNAGGPHCKEQWNYALIIGMLMYLS